MGMAVATGYPLDPSGKRLQFANLKMAIEIVDLPINSMGGSFHSYVMLVYQRISWMMTPEMLGFRLPSPLRQQVLGIPNAGVAHHGLERNPMDVEPETHPSLEVEIPRKFPWCHGSDQSLCHFLVVKPSQTIHAYPCLVRAQLGAHRTIPHGHKATSYWWYHLWGRKILKQPAIWKANQLGGRKL